MAGGFIREVRTVFTAQAGNFRSVTQGMQRDFRNIQTSGRNTAQSTDKDFGKMRTSLLGLQKELQGTGQKTQSLNKLQAVAHEVAAEMDRTGKASEASMNRLREAMKAAGKDTKNFEKLGVSGFMALQNDIVNVEREMNGLGKTTTNVSSQASKGFAQIRKGAMLVTGALAGIGAGLTGAFVFADQYQAAMNKMQMATGATAKETKQLGDAVKNVYAANYGQDMQDVADSMTAVKQATGATGKELEDLTKYAISMRDTFGFEVVESTRAAKQMMQQFGVTGKEAYTLIAQGAQQGANQNDDLLDVIGEYSIQFKNLGYDAEGFMDILISGSQSGAFSMDKLGDSVKESFLLLGQGSDQTKEALTAMGLDADKVTGQIASGGEDAQKAFTAVSAAIATIKDPLKQNQAAVAAFGTPIEDLGPQFATFFADVEKKTNKSADTLKKMNDVKFNTVGDAIRGVGRVILVEMLDPMQKKVLPFVNKMISQFKTNLPQIKQVASDAFGGMANFFVKMQPTIKNLWSALKPIAEVVGVAIYGAFKAMEATLPPITGALSFLIAKFTNMKGFVPIMSGILAAFATFKLYLLAMRAPAMVIQTISVLTRAWAVAQMLLNTVLLANPIGLVIAGIAGLVAAFVVAYKRSETFRNVVNKALNGVKDGALFVLNWLKTNWKTILVVLTGPIGMAVALIVKHWSSIKSATITAFNSVLSFFKQWGPLLLAALAGPVGLAIYAVIKHWDTIKNATITAFNAVKKVISDTINGIKLITGIVISAMVNDVKNQWNQFKAMTIAVFNAVKSFLVSVFNAIKSAVISIVNAYVNQVKQNWNALKSATIAVFNAVKSFLVSVWNTIKTAVNAVVNALVNYVKGQWNALKSITISVFNAVKAFITNTWNSIKSFFNSVVSAIVNYVKGQWNALKSMTTSIFNALKSFLTSVWNAIKNTIQKAANDVFNRVKAVWNNIKNITTSVFNAVKNFLVNTWNAIKNTVSKLANSAKDGVVNAWNTLKNRTTEMFNNIKTKVTSIFDDIVGAAKKLPGRIGDGIKAMAGGVKKGLHLLQIPL